MEPFGTMAFASPSQLAAAGFSMAPPTISRAPTSKTGVILPQPNTDSPGRPDEHVFMSFLLRY
jgi:hypothetical protein